MKVAFVADVSGYNAAIVSLDMSWLFMFRGEEERKRKKEEEERGAKISAWGGSLD